MRKPRIIIAGAKYHVTSRVNHQEMLLHGVEAKQLFLDVVERAKKKFSFKLENFTVMDNHFHFIIKPEHNESLSKIMQWLLSVFAMKYNLIYGLTGHFWQGRFFSRVISSFRMYYEIFTYIDQNPVKASLVDNPWSWEFGGLAHRRVGLSTIVDPLEPELLLVFPTHQIHKLFKA
ncbi:hypothetical protein MASR2M78_00050 [Treponema sp.]